LSDRTPGAPDYSRHTIAVADPRDYLAILRALSRLPAVVVVNIVEPSGKAKLLSEESLMAALAEAPETLTVDALRADAFSAVMRQNVEAGRREAEALRRLLRDRPVSDLGAEVAAVLRHLDQLLLLLTGYALQRDNAAVPRLGHALATLREQMAASAGQFADNVRCMDDLHYEIVPALEKLWNMFRPARA
jgi:hypothetical protein